MKQIILKSIITLSTITLVIISANAQNGTPKIIDEFDKFERNDSELSDDNTNAPVGTKHFNELAYSKAITAYLNKEEKLSDQDQLRLAQAYFHTDQHEEAQQWFSKSIAHSTDVAQTLQYAQSLQRSGNLEEAKVQYANYAKGLRNANATQSTYVYNADVINQERFESHNVELFNETRINTENFEFSPAFYGDQTLYVTTNPAVTENTDKDPWIDENFMGILQANINDEGYLESPQKFSDIISTQYHEGPLTFNKEGNELFFTRNSFANGKKDLSEDKVLKLKIFQTSHSSNKWSEPKQLNFSTAENQECHPTLSANGKTMIFASDRKGAIGKMDLYMSTRNGDTWSEPKNLGNQINSTGNELFPFLASDGMLYFASDTHDGLGGLDIFVSQLIDNNQWSTPKNIGTPFNSQADDFGYIINLENHKGYLTSSRDGGYGKDDIYGFTLDANPFNDNEVIICTVDSLTRDYLIESALELSILNGNDPNTQNLTTTEDGCIRVEINPEKTYRVFSTKDEYHSSETIFSKEKNGNKWTIPLYQPGCVYLTGLVTNSTEGNNIEGATVTIKNLSDNSARTLSTDLVGKFTQCLPCGQDFEITANKTGFDNGWSMLSTSGRDCNSDALITMDIPLSLIIKEEAVYTPEEVTVGEVVVLENIYYDFDQSYIKDEEQIDLDKLVNTMFRYPNLVIELGSHTDSRGNDDYNQNLSERRAQSAKDYLTARGISADRIMAIGYGEDQIRNNCGDDITCTEDEHLYNRRTEVRIIQHDIESVTFELNDNLPSSYSDIEDKVRFTNSNTAEGNTSEPTINSPINNNQSITNSKNPITGLYLGSYGIRENAENKLSKLIGYGYDNVSILPMDANGNYRVILSEQMDKHRLQSLKEELLNYGISSVARYE